MKAAPPLAAPNAVTCAAGRREAIQDSEQSDN